MLHPMIEGEVCVYKLLNYTHIIIFIYVKSISLTFILGLFGAWWHSLCAGRYAVVFTIDGLWWFHTISACIHRPIIRTFGDFGGPRNVTGLCIQRIPDEYQCCNQHDDCYHHDNALEIERTGLLTCIHVCENGKINIIYIFIFIFWVTRIKFIDSIQFNIKYIERV